jgi:hypothetical protein
MEMGYKNFCFLCVLRDSSKILLLISVSVTKVSEVVFFISRSIYLVIGERTRFILITVGDLTRWCHFFNKIASEFNIQLKNL